MCRVPLVMLNSINTSLPTLLICVCTPFKHFLTYLAGAESYPIIGFSYIAIQKAQQPWMDCARRKEAWKFFNYILTDEKTASRAAGNGFSPVGPALAEKVLALLETVECDGISLLACKCSNSYSVLMSQMKHLPPMAMISLYQFLLLQVFWECSHCFPSFGSCKNSFVKSKLTRRSVQLFRGGKLPVPLLIFGIITCVAGILGYVCLSERC